MKQMKFVPACKDFFGQKTGQTLREFMDECKALTDKDRAELKPLLEKALSEQHGTSVQID